MVLRTLLLLFACVEYAPAKELPTSLDQLPATAGLPDLFTFDDGTPVKGLEDWKRRREELKAPLLFYQYGRMPPKPDMVAAKVDRVVEHESGKGTQHWLTLVIGSEKKLEMRIVLYKPKTAGPHPVIVEEEGNIGGSKNAGMFMAKNYMFIEYARDDLAPDRRKSTGPAQRAYPDYDWAMLAVWAWGGMRVVDYLETRGDVDMERIAITGHSRGGKAALLAGAMDERITLVAPAQSGAGGAGASRILGPGAESIGMNDKPDWYHERIQMFAEKEAHLPFDQHFLKALVAPRGLFCNESTDDLYANPVGTEATSSAAMPVFKLYGKQGNNGLRYRRGGHSYSGEDWKALLDFAEWTFFGRGGPIWELPDAVEPLPASGGPGAFVSVGDPGNKPDKDFPRVGAFGAVAHRYEIGRYKVSNSEYARFLSAAAKTDPHALYHPRMKIRREGNPREFRYLAEPEATNAAVTYVSWRDAVRYCNWLHGGDTEKGAYPIAANGSVGARQDGTKFFLPTEDEWYKASYYDADSKSYHMVPLGRHNPLRKLRELRRAPAPRSRYGMIGIEDGTWEWTESKAGELFRGLRSDTWFQGNNRQAQCRFYINPELELDRVGFRICREAGEGSGD